MSNDVLNTQQMSQSSSAPSQDFGMNHTDADARAKSSHFMPSDQATEGRQMRHSQKPMLLSDLEEERLKLLGVLPPLQNKGMVPRPKQKGDDDPFVERSVVVQPDLRSSYRYDLQAETNSSSYERIQPPVMRGTMAQDFRLPSVYQNHPADPPHQSVAKTQQEHDTHVDITNEYVPYQGDPMLYNSFPMSNKNECLLPNPHVVEPSKIQGNLSSSSPTVFFDSANSDLGSNPHMLSAELAFQQAHGDLIRSCSTTETTTSALMNTDKELFKGSDALPWTDRPVDIQNTTSPLASLSVATSTPFPMTRMPPPGLNDRNSEIWALMPPPTSTYRSLEDVELWFSKDVRGEGSAQLEWNACDINSTENGSIQATTRENQAYGDMGKAIMAPIFDNLVGYLDNSSKSDYFGRFARVPEWCIDKSPAGDQSFFGDWGVPPSRVGRDPRYRPTFHEGRFTVFEELDRRAGRDGVARRFH